MGLENRLVVAKAIGGGNGMDRQIKKKKKKMGKIVFSFPAMVGDPLNAGVMLCIHVSSDGIFNA